MVNLFSVPAFFIVLREVLEACLVVGIVLAYLKKSGATHMNKIVWWGAGVGIAVSLIFGIAFVTVFYTRGTQLFKGSAEKIFEGIVFLIAAALLTWMLLWMLMMGKEIQVGLEKQVDGHVEAGGRQGKIGIFSMVFVQVLREGIETWIFLFAGANAEENGKDAWRAIPIPGVLAITVGLLVAWAVFRGMVMLDIQKFFFWSTVILMAFSAGLVSHAFHELQEAHWFGPWDPKAPAVKDWYNARMWSTKACCNDKTNEFFALLRALFGYQDTPTFVEWVTYFAYWVIIGVIYIVFNWRSVRTANETFRKLAKNMSTAALALTFVGFISSLFKAVWNGVLVMTTGLLLSIVAVLISYDFFSKRLAPLAKSRRVIALATGIGFAVLTLFTSTLHIIQMACDEGACNIPKYYYFGLIFLQDWAQGGREANSWVSIAVLSWSLVLTFFFFGILSFALIMYSTHIDRDGKYDRGVGHEELKSNDEERKLVEVDEDSITPDKSIEIPAEISAEIPA